MLGMPRSSRKKTKSPLFSQRKAAVGWRSWWCGNFLLLTEVYSEVQVGGNPNQAPRSTYILYVQKKVYIYVQLCIGLLTKGKSGSSASNSGLVELVN